MRAQLARDDLADEDRFHFHFALGKALEDAGEYAESFEHYADGNRLRRASIRYDAGPHDPARATVPGNVFTREFFADRAGVGTPEPDPIFIVGPAAGRLHAASNRSSRAIPLVEGTMELPDVTAIAQGLARPRERGEASRYPEVVAIARRRTTSRTLGEQYLAADPHPAQDGRAVLHRQDAEQLGARRA